MEKLSHEPFHGWAIMPGFLFRQAKQFNAAFF